MMLSCGFIDVRSNEAPAMTDKALPPENFWALLGIPTHGRELVESVRAGFPFDVIQQLASLSGFSPAELAGMVKIPQGTLRRRREAGLFSKGESDRLYRLSTIIAASIELFQGNATHAKEWLCKPLRYMGDRRPIDMAETGAEADLMLTFILQLEHGITS